MRAVFLAAMLAAAPVSAESFRDRPPSDELIYFVLPTGSRMQTPPTTPAASGAGGCSMASTRPPKAFTWAAI